jgi:ribose transport system permease protein
MTYFLRHNRWTLGLSAFLILLLFITKLIRPEFGYSGLDSLARAALPYAFATAAMAVVVLAGGIDLSVAAMMAVCGVSAAVLMKSGSNDGVGFALLATLMIGLVMGTINGALIVLSRVPDIVVTLAMLFVWQGVALLVLDGPGGAASPWLKELMVGGVTLPGLEGVPKSLAVVVFVITLVWLPVRRSRLGLMIYAVGSDALSAFRTGIPTGRVRIMAYAIAGLFSAFGGLSLTLMTGVGEPVPGPYLLASVAAVVLGGVALSGGKGGLFGPLVAVFILRLLRLDLTLMSVDPNVATIIEGTIMVMVVMLGGVLMMRERRA